MSTKRNQRVGNIGNDYPRLYVECCEYCNCTPNLAGKSGDFDESFNNGLDWRNSPPADTKKPLNLPSHKTFRLLSRKEVDSFQTLVKFA